MDFKNKLFKNSIKTTDMDEILYSSIYKEMEELQNIVKNNIKEYKPVDELAHDVFSSLYKYDPELREEKEMQKEYETNKYLMDVALSLGDYADMRKYTQLDEFSSAICSEVIAEEILNIKKDSDEQAEKMVQEMMEGLDDEDQEGDGDGQGEDDGEGDGEGQGEGNGEGNGEGDGKGKPSSKKGKNKEKRENLLNKTFQDKVKEMMKDRMKKIVRKAMRRNQDMKDASFALGWGTESGSAHKLPFKEKMALARKLKDNDKLRNIMRKAGKMRRLAAHSRKSRITPGSSEAMDIEQGNNINRILPSELMKYEMSDFHKAMFMKRFANSELLQYRLIDRKKDPKGPIVFAIDTSGSMNGDPEIWAKAVVIGMTEIAFKENRAVIVNFFGSSYDPIMKFTFTKQDYNPLKLVEMAEYWYGGGTDFQTPLDECRKDVDNLFPDADIIMITDGICDVEDEWVQGFNEWADEKDVRVTTVLVDCWGDDDSCIKKFSKYIEKISNLGEDSESAESIYKAI